MTIKITFSFDSEVFYIERILLVHLRNIEHPSYPSPYWNRTSIEVIQCEKHAFVPAVYFKVHDRHIEWFTWLPTYVKNSTSGEVQRETKRILTNDVDMSFENSSIQAPNI